MSSSRKCFQLLLCNSLALYVLSTTKKMVTKQHDASPKLILRFHNSTEHSVVVNALTLDSVVAFRTTRALRASGFAESTPRVALRADTLWSSPCQGRQHQTPPRVIIDAAHTRADAVKSSPSPRQPTQPTDALPRNVERNISNSSRLSC